MNKIKISIILSSMIIISALSHAEVYKWTDSTGSVHYSDSPGPNAIKVEIPGIQTFSPAEQPVPISEKRAEAKKHLYTKLAIIQPENEATIRNNQGYLMVSTESDPALQEGDLLRVMYDGKAFGKPQTNANFALNAIERGTHILTVEIIDAEGNQLIVSDPIKFHMQRPRVNMVPRNKPAT